MAIEKAALFVGCFLVFGCGSGSGNGDRVGSGGGSGSGGSGGQTGGSGGQGQGGSTSGGSGGDGGSGTGGASFAGWTRADSGTGDAISGSAHVAIAPDGTIYVSWAENTNGVMVARSKDGGASFEPKVQVNATAVPLVSMARHPYVVATDTRVAVSFNDTEGGVYLHTADASGALSFGAATMIGTDIVTDFRDFPRAVFLADGSLGVAWHGYPDSGARIFFSRENDGYMANAASSGAPGLPCECCPLDVQKLASGELVLAFRNNDDNTREMWAARATSDGTFGSWAGISTSEGTVATCPMMGPRMAENGSLLVSVWSSRGASTAGQVFTATSTDGGKVWSGGAAAGGFSADEPTIAIGASGRIFVTGVTGGSASASVHSDNQGQSWSAPEALDTPDGALKVPQAQSSGGIAILAGVTTASSVWMRRME
jgi:hypothetical protein